MENATATRDAVGMSLAEDGSTALPRQRGDALQLDEALSGLGHQCPAGCAASVQALGAHVWFVHRGRHPGPAGGAVVIIDLNDSQPLAQVQVLLRAVNRCTSSDGIQVRQRSMSGHRHALSALRGASAPLDLLPALAHRIGVRARQGKAR